MAETISHPVLLLTRPHNDSERVVSALGPIQADVVISPTTSIEPLSYSAPSSPTNFILTSANAAHALKGAMGTVYCVGQRTAAVARDAGLKAYSADGNASSLIKLVVKADPPGTLVYLRGSHISVDLVAELAARGLNAEQVIVYRQVDLPLSTDAGAALVGPAPVILPIFSPRSATALGKLPNRMGPLHVVAISPSAAKVCAPLSPTSVTVAKRPDLASMVQSIHAVLAAI